MIYLIAFLVIAVYGAWYAKDPMRSLRRKFGTDEVPKASIQTARVVGIALVVIGVAGFFYSAGKLLAAS
jgi:small-conductance mechanosensitive channel